MYKSLSNVIVAIFIKWWNALISNLIFDNGSRNGTNMPVLPKTASVEPINYSNIPAVDRNAYLEAIGRIIAHPYWNFSDDTGSYQVLLTSTLSYVIDKLGKLKILLLQWVPLLVKFSLMHFSNCLMSPMRYCFC